MAYYANITKLFGIVSGAIRSRNDAKINIDNLAIMLSDNINTYASLISKLKAIDAADSGKILRMVYDKARVGNKAYDPKLLKMVLELPKLIKPKKNMIVNMLRNATAIEIMLKDMEKNFSKLLTNDFALSDMKLSATMVFSMVQIARIYAVYCTHYATLILTLANNDDEGFPKHLTMHLLERKNDFVTMSKYFGRTKTSIVSEVRALRKRGLDIKLNTAEEYPPDALITEINKIINFTDTKAGMIGNILDFVLQIFATLGEGFVDYRHAYYESMEQKQKWMSAQLAMLQLQMDGVSPTSDEYKQLKKSTEYYKEKIAKYDKKLDNYYGDNR